MNDLEMQINYIKNKIPFYLSNYNNVQNISELPLITKQDIKEKYNEFISNDYLHMKKELLSMLEKDEFILKRKTDCEVPLDQNSNFIIEQTTGTSGLPFRCVKTKAERIKLALSLWNMRRNIDNRLQNSNFVLFNHVPLEKKNYDIYNYKINNLVKIYEEIKSNKYRWLHASPDILDKHVEIFTTNGICINLPDLKHIECTGNYLGEEKENRISSYFNATIVNQYGTIETWPIALSCVHGHMHVNSKSVYVELIDDYERVITEYNKIGRIVVTTLINKLVPFVRYLTGDYGYFEKKTCDCNLGNTVITIMQGREINLIKGLKMKRSGVQLFGRVLGKINREIILNDMTYVQVIQTDINNFILYTNRINNSIYFFKLFEKYTFELLEKKVDIEYRLLSEEEVQNKLKEKSHIFLCGF